MKIIVTLSKMQVTALGPAAPSCLARRAGAWRRWKRGFATRSNVTCNPRAAYGTQAKFRNMAFWHKREHKGTERNMFFKESPSTSPVKLNQTHVGRVPSHAEPSQQSMNPKIHQSNFGVSTVFCGMLRAFALARACIGSKNCPKSQ